MGKLDTEVRGCNFFCGCGWWTFTVMQNGDIMGCPAIDHTELKEGNIRNTDIKEIWWDGFRRFRGVLPENLPQVCKECEHVTVCRGGCWAQRVNRGRFCYLDLAEKLHAKIGHNEGGG
jgi:radical SAM protein with 4Fe4S-binding SPASM domain